MSDIERSRTMLAALAHEIDAPPESASIVEFTAISRESHEEVEDHRRMVSLMTSSGHRQRAIASIVDRMTYLELIDFAADLFKDTTTLEAANFPSHMARWARTTRETIR